MQEEIEGPEQVESDERGGGVLGVTRGPGGGVRVVGGRYAAVGIPARFPDGGAKFFYVYVYV